jgi:uncharacterized membrane protein YdjX (TVP38/TMEM64 family)
VSPRIKLIVLVLVLGAGALLTRTAWADRFEPTVIVAFLRELGSSVAAVPLFLVMFLLATTLFAPAVTLMLAAGVTWGAWPGIVIVWAGANLATHAHFVLGRWVAGDTIRRLLARPQVAWLSRELEHGGVFTTILIRQLPLPFLLVNLAGGASPMPWSRWAIGNAVGLLPNCIIYTQLAATIVAGVEGSGRELAVRVGLTATLVIAMSLVGRVVQRRFARPVS